MTTTDVTPSRESRTNWPRLFFIATAVIAVLYLPLAINYTWPLFFSGASRLQDDVNTAVNGNEYAVGKGSVEDFRHADYARHRGVMLVHTTLGALALGLALFQFSTRLRTAWPAVHRWTGRTYLALMTASMLTAIIFLIGSSPISHYSGRAFDLQLWMLALGTLFGGWYALVAIRRRDIVAHRAWMTYSIALMMTAPLLRVLWIGIQPLLPQHVLLDNLGASAVLLGVIAPFSAAVAFMLTQRGRGTGDEKPAPANRYVGLLAVAALGSVGYVAQFAGLPEDIPPVYLAFHLVPAWLAIGIAGVGIRNGRAQGNPVREQRWRWLLTGVALAPVAASATALIAAPAYGATNAFIAGGMVGAPLAISLAFALVVHTAGTRARASGRVSRSVETPLAVG